MVDLQVATVDPVVVEHDQLRELGIVAAQRRHRAIERHVDHVQRTQRLLLKPLQLVLEVDARGPRGGQQRTRVCRYELGFLAPGRAA